MALLPTKKITALAPAVTPLTGFEEFECVQLANSRKVTARDFVLPLDSLLTISAMGGSLPGSRQLTEGIGIVFVDGGPGSTLQINASGAVAGPANPTASVGLAAVNGAAITYMRSDAAPALSQAIIPIWTGLHTFTAGADSARDFFPFYRITETDAAVDNRVWEWSANGEQFVGRVGNDLLNTFTDWVAVDRTGITVDAIGLFATTVSVNGANVRDATNLFNTGTVPAARLPSSFSGLANPTASVGLAAVNGAATTAMRSDAAPALDQAIAPTWTAQHVFSLSGATNAAVFASSAQPQVDWNETDAAANNRRWRLEAQGEQFLGRTINDANSAAVTWLAVDRTLNVVDAIALTSTALTWNGNPLLSTATAFANPTASLGLAAINGAATTAMRSDAAPALDQAIAPTWTAQHIFSLTGATNAAILASSVQPQVDWNETDGAANNRRWRIEVQAEQFLFRTVDDANSAAVTWLSVDRTLNVIDTVTFPSSPVNFSNAGGHGFLVTRTANPSFRIQESAAAVDNRLWDVAALTETLTFRTVNDAVSVTSTWMSVDRTGTTVDQVTFPTTTANSFRVGGASPSLNNRQAIITSGATGVLGVTQTGVAGNDGAAIHHQATAGDNSFMQFGTEAAFTTRGSISYNRAGGLTAYNTTSDSRRKKNIRDAPDSSSIIDAIKIRSFEWRDSDISLSHWMVAQELHAICPYAVSQGDENRDWAIDPSKLVPLMVKELQSLRSRVRLLEQPGNRENSNSAGI